MESLQWILIEHASLVDTYILNRQADMVEWKLLLVDGTHWNGMRNQTDLERTGILGELQLGLFIQLMYNIADSLLYSSTSGLVGKWVYEL